MDKVSIIIPVYYNQDNLRPLYDDIKNRILNLALFDCEIVMVDDGSGDKSWDVIKGLAKEDSRITPIKLSRNFGSHAAILCGLSYATGDCAVIKAADLQEPTEMIISMYQSWKNGNNVVLAVREGREESLGQKAFANLYYWLVRKAALPKMPKGGFDTFLLDRKAIEVLKKMDERNSAITGQILWSGFTTDIVYYVRKAREIGKSRWTLKKKIRLVTDTLFSFSNLPIKIVTTVGGFSFIGAFVWALVVLINRLNGAIEVSGFTTLFIFQLFSFGVIMLTLGLLGGYLWRAFDASRDRPVYIVEEDEI
ncbi:MAG: glycosyltransferase family 2 protein [Pygmaiobacter sp.]|nr:glycosyltransferase family 2 protein [Pygmaiobacter sp.]